jgi:hypothetical protein
VTFEFKAHAFKFLRVACIVDHLTDRTPGTRSIGSIGSTLWQDFGCAQSGANYARVLGRAHIGAPRLLYIGVAVPPATFEPNGCSSTRAPGGRVPPSSVGPAPAPVRPLARKPELEAVRPDGAGEAE